MPGWFVYIVECKDKSYYTGITTDIDRRVSMHNNKAGARSLYGKLPVKLIYKEAYDDQVTAAKREYEIKSWRRTKKQDLVNGSL